MATQTDLDKIKAAYYQGVSEVEFNGRKVKYRSLKEMSQIIDTMERDLGKSGPAVVALTTDRGYR